MNESRNPSDKAVAFWLLRTSNNSRRHAGLTTVAIARWLERHQPHRRDTESVQIVETTHEPLELTDSISISICIHESRDGETIDYRVLVPKVIDHCRRY